MLMSNQLIGFGASDIGKGAVTQISGPSGSGLVAANFSFQASVGAGALANLFNGTQTNSTAAAGWQGTDSTTGHFIAAGQQYTGARKVDHAVWYGTTNAAVVGVGSGTFSLNLYGSNSSPSNGTNGTLLGTQTFTDGNSVSITITSTDQETPYTYIWVEHTVVSGASDGFLCGGQLKIFGYANA